MRSPILAAIKWKDGNGGHAKVIYAYDSWNEVYFMNPLPDDETWNIMSYDDYVDNDESYWYRTFYKNQLE